MQRSYYFLLASLPDLVWGRRAPLNLDEFLDRCRPQLEEDVFGELAGAGLYQEHPRAVCHPVLRRWYDWEHSLRNVLARHRAERLGVKADPYLRACSEDPEVGKTVQGVQSVASPLEAEAELDSARWRRLEELEFGQEYQLGQLLVYGLKLRLLLRRGSFDAATGENRCRAFQESAQRLSRFAGRAGAEPVG